MAKPSNHIYEQQVTALLGAMTLEEKVSLCHAGSKFSVNPVPRLGIPELVMSDGPHGVRQEISRDSWEPAGLTTDAGTYLPTGTALAATWDPRLAKKFGAVLGAEARERGKDIILGPGINLVRTPLCGRNFEYYSEDPHLIRSLVVPVIRAIQEQGVAACVKHFAANSQELNRNAVDAVMDERTLRELYLPGFRAAVVEGGCLTVMGAYNKFRGQHCCHHEYLLNRILKQEWGFQGAVISDWAGVHDTFEAARFGLDLEMGTDGPYDAYYLARPFLEAIKDGQLPEALVDDKVRRLLRVMAAIGLLDAGGQGRKAGARNLRRHQQAALEIARNAIVLLKNDQGLLPLRPETLKRLVVIGPNATAQHANGGNSSAVKALYEVTPLEGLRNRLPAGVGLRHFSGHGETGPAASLIPAEYLGIADPGAGTNGWVASYFANRDLAGTPEVRRAETTIDHDWNGTMPATGRRVLDGAVKWEGVISVPQSGIYEFVLEGVEHADLLVDGQSAIFRWGAEGASRGNRRLELAAGVPHAVTVVLRAIRDQVRIRLGWVPPWQAAATENDEEMAAAIRQADAVLFFGGLDHQSDVEGADRCDLGLPGGQDALIARVAELNPRIVVVLAGGSPVVMPWFDRVPAVLWMWYAGMEGGNAVADVLLGRVNPCGKLPFTFPARLQDSPAHALHDYAPEKCRYQEGVFVGYRWFDARGIAPLFCFGHGLSYTSFTYDELEVAAQGHGRGWRGTVSARITNVGSRPGAEVAQLYVEDVEASQPRPPRELKGFVKLRLKPGETRRVVFRLKADDLAFFCPLTGRWVAEPGQFRVHLGASSRDLRLTGGFILR